MANEVSAMVEAFNMFQAQYDQVDKLWNYFGVISLAIAGFTIGSEKATRTIWEPIVIVIGYLSFCIGNFQALINGHGFLVTLADRYNDLAVDQGLNHLKVHTVDEVTAFYVLVVITFTTAIILVSATRIKNHKTSQNGEAE